jgi:transposase-like protein
LCGLEVSRSQVSALVVDLEAQLAAWRSRPLGKRYLYLMIDARYEKVRRRPHVVSQVVLVWLGIGEDGRREVLGTYLADSEREAAWSDVFKDLKGRGLEGVRYAVSDDHEGLVAAVQRYFQGAVWQRCQVHVVRNLLAKVLPKDRPWVLERWRAAREAKTLQEARTRLRELVERLGAKYPEVAAWLEEAGEEVLAVYALPEAHRKRMRSTNMLERLNQELKRRTRVVRIFPDGPSCLRLVTALAMETSEEWEARIYLDMTVDGPAAESARSAA